MEITFKNIYDTIFDKTYDNHKCIINFKGKTRNSFTKEEYRYIVNYISKNFKKMYPDIKKDSWVGLKFENSYSYYAILFAGMKLGWNILLIDSKNSNYDIEKYKEDIELQIVLDNNVLKKLNYDDALQKNKNDISIKEYKENIWADKIGFFSSGSTGKRQIIIYDASAILNQIKNVQYEFLNNTILPKIINKLDISERKVVTFLPMHHILGFLLPLIIITLDISVIFLEDQTLYGIIRAIKEEQAVGSFGVPMVWRLIKNVLTRKYTSDTNGLKELLGDKFKIILSGGSKTDIEIRKYYINLGIEFFVGYGLTETGFLSIGQSIINEYDSEGKIYNNYKFKVITSEEKIQDEGIGELIVGSNAIYRSVMRNRQEIFPKLLNGLYYKTGDIFKLKDKKIYFKGRKKNIIVDESGENIYIEELEENFNYIKLRGILYFVSEYNGKASIVIDETSCENFSKDSIINSIKRKNKELIPLKRIYQIFFLTDGILFTQKGDPIRILESYKTIGKMISIKGE